MFLLDSPKSYRQINCVIFSTLGLDLEIQVSTYFILLPAATTYTNVFLCRYDHLSRVLSKALDERPENIVDIFEDLSKDEKRAKFTSDVDTVQNRDDKSTEVALAEVQEKLFSVSTMYYNILVTK